MILTDVFTIDEAADKLRCSSRTIRRKIKSGELEAVRFAGKWIITAEAIAAVIQPEKPIEKPSRRGPYTKYV